VYICNFAKVVLILPYQIDSLWVHMKAVTLWQKMKLLKA